MMKVLLSKHIDPALSDLLLSRGWQIDKTKLLTITLLKINSIPDCNYLALTSPHAFDAIEKGTEIPGKKLFCVGERLEKKLQRSAYKGLIQVYNKVEDLIAGLRLESGGVVHYLCGKHHRDLLPDSLNKMKNFSLSTQIAYHSDLLCPILDTKDYQAVTVYSPRAAESLFTHNRFPDSTLFACIGPVTAEAVRDYGYSNVIYPEKPLSLSLINTLIQYDTE